MRPIYLHNVTRLALFDLCARSFVVTRSDKSRIEGTANAPEDAIKGRQGGGIKGAQVPRPSRWGLLIAVLGGIIISTLSLESPRAGAQGTDAKRLGQAYRAFLANHNRAARLVAEKIHREKLLNPDYADYVLAQSSLLTGKPKAALAAFSRLATNKTSRFAKRAKWGVADSLWSLGNYPAAAKQYKTLLKNAGRSEDSGLARFRLAEAERQAGKKAKAIASFRSFRVRHPGHALEARATQALIALGGRRAATYSHRDRVTRAERLTNAKNWHAAIAELRQVPDDAPSDIVLLRDYWIGTSLFKMRRRYKEAGDLLFGLYKRMGSRAAKAMFRGVRAWSRADFDEQAIVGYQQVVAEYPKSEWAPEAQFLSGWLNFNLGKYREAIPYLAKMATLYPRSKFTRTAVWYLGFSHYLLGERDNALTYFDKLAKRNDRLEGGKGRYWAARARWLMGQKSVANDAYKALIARYPFSWYALLAQARLARQGISVDPFGGRGARTRSSAVPAIAAKVPAAMANDPLIAQVDELIGIGLGSEAALELRRGERSFVKRHDRAVAYATVLDRYRRAGNYNRPWMLSVVVGSRALNQKPVGKARIWWQHAYPLAYRDWVEQYSKENDTPPTYLFSIMRKESGFNPNTHSYANAIGLLQMIPPTTRRVVRALNLNYTDDLLFDPKLNIKTGAWYISRLLKKFKNQIPLGAGSFNAGPRPIMRWMKKLKGHPLDEFVELTSYSQTRGYMKKVTETYARYLYLYNGEVYKQPLDVDTDFLDNELTY